MIEFIKGDITKETRGLILHGCNAKGVMGSGVALAIKNKWPAAYEAYKHATQGQKAMGRLQIVSISNGLYIGNGWTQLSFGNDGKKYADIEAIRSVLEQAFLFCEKYELPLKMPRIGGLRGGLDWEKEVYPIIMDLALELESVEVKIIDLA
jgi:hypothetical protein